MALNVGSIPQSAPPISLSLTHTTPSLFFSSSTGIYTALSNLYEQYEPVDTDEAKRRLVLCLIFVKNLRLLCDKNMIKADVTSKLKNLGHPISMADSVHETKQFVSFLQLEIVKNQKRLCVCILILYLGYYSCILFSLNY